MILLTAIGVLIPSVIVKRKATERSPSIFKDLPDCLDLLAISVEAGVGFEAALDVVCSHFDSPLAEEFRRTLQEMELGLGPRDALVNLRNRTNVPELSTFIMALTQADALGMPIGRVLHTQAVEMRTGVGSGPESGRQTAGQDHVSPGVLHLPRHPRGHPLPGGGRHR